MNTFYILLVDDDSDVALILQGIAKDLFPEAKIIHMPSVVQAKAYLGVTENKRPRLILLDVDLRAKDSGLEYIPFLRAQPLGRSTPIVILSNSAHEEDVDLAYDYSVNAYTQKPHTSEGWLDYVKQLRAFWYDVSTVPK